MKCYSTQNGTIASGFSVQSDEKLGMVLGLGEVGRGREYTKIKLDGRCPPVVVDGRVHEADVVEFEAGGRKRHALTTSRPGDGRILVRVCSGTGYTRRGGGSASTYWGNSVVLESGYGADGDAGRIGSWGDYLMVVVPGEALFVQPSGGVDGYIFYLPPQGEPQGWKPEEFRTEVLATWLQVATVEDIESRLTTATERRQNKLALFLRSALSERVVEAGTATETIRRNLRWDEGQKAVVVDLVTVFHGTEIKTEIVLADPTREDEGKVAARMLAENFFEALVIAKAIIEAGEKFSSADPAKTVHAPRFWDVQVVIAEILFGCVTAEEARKRDLSSITLERWISADEQARVRASRPETIEVLGLRKAVKYSYGQASVEVSFAELTPTQWLDAHGPLTLTDGTPVVVEVKGEGWSIQMTKGELATLPAKISRAAAKAAFELWEKPVPALPFELIEDESARSLEVVYGRDALTGENLVAFGRWEYTSWYGLTVRWYQTAEQADGAHVFSGTELESVREYLRKQDAERIEREAREAKSAREQAAHAEASVEAETFRKEMLGLQSSKDWFGLDYQLRRKVDDRRYSLPITAEDVRQWTIETKAIIAEVETALAEVQRQRGEEVKVQAAAEQVKREQFRVLLAHEWVGGNLSLAERIDAFVKDAVSLRGRQALALLKREEDGRYGRGGRTQGIQEGFPGIDHRGLDWAADRDIVPVTFWAEVLAQKQSPSSTAKSSAVSTVVAPPASTEQVLSAKDLLMAKFGKKR